MPKFAANLSFLWTELPLLKRVDAARDAGFAAVEYMSPYELPASEIRARLDAAGLQQALFNLPAGDWAAGDRGTASDPSRVAEFKEGVDQALVYAEVLDCPQCNCLAGLRLEKVTPQLQWQTLVENVRWAAERFARAGRRLLIEPINTYDVAGFFVPTATQALQLIDEAGDDKVMLQFDAYHTERMEGDAPGRLRALIDRIGHIQIADNPGRHQPGTGELDFAGLFAAIEDVGYTGWVGLEYIPTDGTLESLTWLDQFGFSLATRS